MGNTPSTPPPLVSINAPGNDVLIPSGTSLYACPPFNPGYQSPCPYTEHAAPTCQQCRPAPRGPVYSRIPARSRRHRDGPDEPDVRILEYEERSESTGMDEVPVRRQLGKALEMQRPRAARPYDEDSRSSIAPAGYAGLHAGAEEMGMNGMGPQGLYPQVYPGLYARGPGMSPHISVPPQYVSNESIPRYAHGVGSARNGNGYATYLPKPPPLSTRSSSSSSGSGSRALPSTIQAAIDEAIQKSTEKAGVSRATLERFKTSTAIFTKDDGKDRWGDGIDTCICTTNCKCSKGGRAVKLYEGMAKIGDQEVPVRAKLNTPFVLQDDAGKDCGDSGCKERRGSESSSSSSTSDTEAPEPRKNRKSQRKWEKTWKAEALKALQVELERAKQAAAIKQGRPHGPSPFARYSPSTIEDHDPKTMRDPHEMGRMVGMEPPVKMQGTYDPMTTRYSWLPRMPPKPGMRMRSQNDGFTEDSEDMGPSALRGKGKHSDLRQGKRRPRFGLRNDLDSDSHPSTSNRSRDSKKGGKMTEISRRGRAFELDGTDVSLDLRRQSAIRGFCGDEYEETPMDSLSRYGDGEKNGGGSPRGVWARISPTGRRGGAHRGRITGKQARAEKDDDEVC